MNITCKIYITSIALVLMHGVSAQQTLSLEVCKQMALEQNKTLRIARHNVELAMAEKSEADAGGKPTLDLSGGGFYFGDPINTLAPEYGVNAMLGITQSVYTGGKVKTGKLAAQKGLEISEEQERQQVSEVIYNTEQAYWNVIAMSEKIALANRYQELLDTLLQDLTNSYEAGLTYKNDLLQVKVQRYEAELNKREAEDGLILAKMYLAQMIGRGNDTGFEVENSVSGTFDERTAEDLQAAVANRPEIQILQKSVEASQLQESLLRADFKPMVSWSINGIYAAGPGVNFSDGGDQFTSYYSMLNISLPIWDWGQRRQKVKQQTFRTASSEVQLEDTREVLTMEIRQVYLELNESAMRVSMCEEALVQADENLKLSNDRLGAGTITGSDVLEAQALWQETYSALIDARVRYKINAANLERVLGN